MSAVVLTAQVVPVGRGWVARLQMVEQAHHLDDRPARHSQLVSRAGEFGAAERQVEPPRIEPDRVAGPQQLEGGLAIAPRPGGSTMSAWATSWRAVAAGGMDCRVDKLAVAALRRRRDRSGRQRPPRWIRRDGRRGWCPGRGRISASPRSGCGTFMIRWRPDGRGAGYSPGPRPVAGHAARPASHESGSPTGSGRHGASRPHSIMTENRHEFSYTATGPRVRQRRLGRLRGRCASRRRRSLKDRHPTTARGSSRTGCGPRGGPRVGEAAGSGPEGSARKKSDGSQNPERWRAGGRSRTGQASVPCVGRRVL